MGGFGGRNRKGEMYLYYNFKKFKKKVEHILITGRQIFVGSQTAWSIEGVPSLGQSVSTHNTH